MYPGLGLNATGEDSYMEIPGTPQGPDTPDAPAPEASGDDRSADHEAGRGSRWAVGWRYDAEAVGECPARSPDILRRNPRRGDCVFDEAVGRVGIAAHPSRKVPDLGIKCVNRVKRIPECAGDDEDRSCALRISVVGSIIHDAGAHKRAS